MLIHGLTAGNQKKVALLDDDGKLVISGTFGGGGGGGDASAANQAALNALIGTGDDSTGAFTVLGRLKTLSTNFGTLSTYVDGLEGFASTLNGLVDGLEGLLTSTNSTLTTLNTYVDGLEGLLGSTAETAPATDTATAGVNGRLQRVCQRLTSLITLVGEVQANPTANTLLGRLKNNGPSSGVKKLNSSVAGTNINLIKTGAGAVKWIEGHVVSACILKFWDLAAAPTDLAASPSVAALLANIYLPVGDFELRPQIEFGLGCSFAVLASSAIAENSVAPTTAGALTLLNIGYS